MEGRGSQGETLHPFKHRVKLTYFQCVHYVLDKPWMERPTWEKTEAADAVKITHSWWWDAKDRLERRIKRDDCLGLWDLVGPYLRITVA